MEELKKKIYELINRVTNSVYTSTLDVRYEDGVYILRLDLNCKDAAPISLGYQGDEDGFLLYLENEFRKRKLQNTRYTKGNLVTGDRKSPFYPIIEL